MYSNKELNIGVFPGQMVALEELAVKIGYRTKWIDRWAGYLLEINGKLFGYGFFPKFPINSAESRALCKDKAFSYMILEQNGFKVPEGDYFIKYDEKYLDNSRGKGIEEALNYAEQIGYPVFVKPNRMMMGLWCEEIFNKDSLRNQIEKIFAEDYIVLVQKVIRKKEYRIVVLDGEILLCYQKSADVVVGDGVSGLEKLTEGKENIDWDYLQLQGFDKDSILQSGKAIKLRSNANLSTGGKIVEVVNDYPRVLQDYVQRMGKVIGTRFFGLDLFADDLSNNDSFEVIEVNADAGFDEFRKYDEKKVTEIYQKVLEKCF